MAWTTGTATDYNDLLDDLRAYLVAQGWTVLNWVAPTGVNSNGTLQVRAPGAGVGREVFLNIRSEFNTTTGAYGWNVRGASGYTAGQPAGGNPGELQTPVYFNTWQNSIPYWFFVNNRRVIVVAKVSTAYICLYAGFYLPFATPTNYPFPLFVGGDWYNLTSWSTVDASRRFFVDPGGPNLSTTTSSAQYRDHGGSWRPVINHRDGISNDLGSSAQASSTILWPHRGDHNSRGTITYDQWGGNSNGGSTNGAMDSFVATRQGERVLLPCTIARQDMGQVGVLDGCWAALGQGLAAEQTITIGGTTYIVFPNISRASGNDFFLVERV